MKKTIIFIFVFCMPFVCVAEQLKEYVNKKCGFSIKYPEGAGITEGKNGMALEDLLYNGGVFRDSGTTARSACSTVFELPRAQPGTNLFSEKMTVTALYNCPEKYAKEAGFRSFKEEKISGRTFYVIEYFDGAMGEYHLSYSYFTGKDACFCITVDYGTSRDDEKQYRVFDPALENKRVRKIIETFRTFASSSTVEVKDSMKLEDAYDEVLALSGRSCIRSGNRKMAAYMDYGLEPGLSAEERLKALRNAKPQLKIKNLDTAVFVEPDSSGAWGNLDLEPKCWSFDGSKLAVQERQPPFRMLVAGISGDAAQILRVIDPETFIVKDITFSAVLFSEDAKYLVFTAYTGGKHGKERTNQVLYACEIASGKITQLTDSTMELSLWQDGRPVHFGAYEGATSTAWELWSTDDKGEGKTKFMEGVFNH